MYECTVKFFSQINGKQFDCEQFDAKQINGGQFDGISQSDLVGPDGVDNPVKVGLNPRVGAGDGGGAPAALAHDAHQDARSAPLVPHQRASRVPLSKK